MNYKLSFLFLFFLQGASSQVYQWTSKDSDVTTIYKVQKDSNYLIETVYQTNPPKFLRTRGGFYKKKNEILNLRLEFNSNYPNDSVGHLEYIIPKNAKVVSSLILELNGKWLMSGRINSEGQIKRRDIDRPRKTLKFLTDGFFQWTAFNNETFQFYGCGGGKYSAQEGEYEESIIYFSRDDSRSGQKLAFKYEKKNNDWHHTGYSSKGKPLYEIWTLRK